MRLTPFSDASLEVIRRLFGALHLLPSLKDEACRRETKPMTCILLLI